MSKALQLGELFHVGYSLYTLNGDEEPLDVIFKRYPQGVITGQTALYLHALIDKSHHLHQTSKPPSRGGVHAVYIKETAYHSSVPLCRLEAQGYHEGNGGYADNQRDHGDTSRIISEVSVLAGHYGHHGHGG